MIIQYMKSEPIEEQIIRPFGKTSDGGGDDGVFHVSFDPEDDSVVQVLIDAVAALHNTPPEQLDPLAESIDLDLLEKLVDPDSGETVRGGELTFQYEGLDVTVDSDGDIWLKWY